MFNLYTSQFRVNHDTSAIFANDHLLTSNNNKTLLNFLKILEKYLFSIEFYDGEAIEELCINLFNFAEAVVKLNKGEWVIQGIIDKLKKLYESLVNSTELNKKTVLYYSKNGFYRTSWLRYFLCEYEYSLMKKSKTNINKLQGLSDQTFTMDYRW